MTEYKATPEQWADVGAFASDTRACIFELRARVEALEANSSAPLTSSNYPAKPDSSLVERVERRIRHAHEVGGFQARAAIHEVAAWMTSNPDVYFPPALVFALEQETER